MTNYKVPAVTQITQRVAPSALATAHGSKYDAGLDVIDREPVEFCELADAKRRVVTLSQRPARPAASSALSFQGRLYRGSGIVVVDCLVLPAPAQLFQALTLMAPAFQGDESFEKHVDTLVQSRTEAEVYVTYSYRL